MRIGLLLAAACGLVPDGAAASDLNHPLSEVVVTASPVGGDPNRFATLVEQVSREEILAHGGTSLADALRDAPGVAGTGFAAGASRPVIRGMDAERVRLTENGLAGADVSDLGPDHGVPIDPLAAQSIELVRGAATLRYGSQAIGGVVNAINNRIPRRRLEGIAGEATAAYGAGAGAAEGSLMLDAGSGPMAFHLDGFARRAGDYRIPGGRQANTFFRGRGYSGGASYFAGDSRLGGSGTHYRARYGLPAGGSFIRMRQSKAAFGAALRPAGGPLRSLNLDAGYADYAHSEIEDGAAHATFSNREWDGRAEAVFGAVGPLSGAALGLQLQDRRFAALGEGADYLLPAHTASAAAFAFVEAPAGRLHLQGALRLERARVEGTPARGVATRRRFTPVSVSAGVTYDLTDRLRLGLSAASAARAPAQTELFARGPHDGPATFETGDPALTVERANSLEATARRRLGGKGRVEASVWRARYRNYIHGALSGRVCDEAGACGFAGDGELKELLFTQRGARFWGVELKGVVPLGRAMGGELGAQVLGDYVRARFAGGGDLPRIQPGRLGGGLHWETARLDASFLVLRVAAQRRVGAADLPTGAYTSADAQLGWRPLGNRPEIELLLAVRNLANAAIRNASAFNKDRVIMPGRDIRLVTRATF